MPEQKDFSSFFSDSLTHFCSDHLPRLLTRKLIYKSNTNTWLVSPARQRSNAHWHKKQRFSITNSISNFYSNLNLMKMQSSTMHSLRGGSTEGEIKLSNTFRIEITLRPLSFYCTTIKRCFLKSFEHNHVLSRAGREGEVNLLRVRVCGFWRQREADYTKINITFAGNKNQT